MKLQLLASAALALLAAVPGAVSEEPHAAVAKPIESFTNVVQAVSPKKDDSYDEDSYDMDSYDEDSEDEELEAVGVAKKSRKRSRGRRRRRRRRRSRGRRRRRRRSRDRRRRRRRSRRRSCRSSFCWDRPWSWECRHCRFEGEDMELMESGPISSGDYSSSSDYPDYSSDLSDLSKDSSDLSEDSSDLSESESEDLDLDSMDLDLEDEGRSWSRRYRRGRRYRGRRYRRYRGRRFYRRRYSRRFYRGRGRSFCRRNPWRCSDSASDSAESYDSYDEEY